MKQNSYSQRRRLWLWPFGRNDSPTGGVGKKWFVLLALLLMVVTGAQAQAYITDVATFGSGNKNTIQSLKTTYTNNGWTIVDKDLNEGAGGIYIFIAYKTSSTANPETGYVTEIIASNKNQASMYLYNRWYYAVPHENYNGDLNNDAGGADIFLYYTRDRTDLQSFPDHNLPNGSKRVIKGLRTVSSSGDNFPWVPVHWHNASYTGPCELNKGAGGSDIYLQMEYAEQTLKMNNHPTFATDLVYNGSAQNLVTSAPSGNWGRMYYKVRIDNIDIWTISLPQATDVGTYDVEYYLNGEPYAYSTQHYQHTVTIDAPTAKAANLSAKFDQVQKHVVLTWQCPDLPGSFTDFNWKVYRGGDLIATLDPDVDTYEDLTMENEQDVTYTVYYAPTFWGDQLKEVSKASITVNTTRTVPVNNLQAVSSSEKVTLTWSSIGYPSSMNHKFLVYATPAKGQEVLYATITPAEGQTEFTWEHRDNDALANQSPIHHNNEYTEEDLDACTMFTYRVAGQIDDKELNSAEERDKAIGAGTTFENFVASKGDNQGSVLLTWNVKRLEGQSQAETYVIERRVKSQVDDEDAWQKLTTLDSDKTFLIWEDKTTLPGVFYEYRITCYNYCENGNRPATTVKDTGFALSSGVISGRVTYGTGTAVSDVKVTLRQNNDEGEPVNHMHSLQFTGDKTGFYFDTTVKEMKKLMDGDFTIQAWVNPNNAEMSTHWTSSNKANYMLFDVSLVYSIIMQYDQNNKRYRLGANYNGTTNTTDLYIPANKWSHVTCVYNKAAQTTTFYVTTDADHIASGVITGISAKAVDNQTRLAIGNSTGLDYTYNYRGYLDEFRFFKRTLTQTEIAKNFNHPMGGTETDLSIYYPMDENMGAQDIIYDFSKSNNRSNGHHAKAKVAALSSDYVPSEEQLSLMGLTDTQGNYVIRGVPFSGEGTNYTIIPTLGIHEFSPAYLSRYVSASSLVHNGVDFEDVSAFPVSGTVRYANTDYPVEGCNIYVDGQISAKNGEPITTNDNGEFTVSVPIGDHFIQIVKSGHTFAAAGRYPADPNSLDLTHTFDQKITGLEFIDETLVNYTGRVVGGSIEGEKPVGFGLSENNIGVTELVLSPMNELYRMNVVNTVTETTSSLDTNTENLPVVSATTNINSSSWRGATADYCKKIYIRTDPQTGEFSAMLPPLQYKVESMKVVQTGLEVGSATTIDLTNPQRTQTDSVRNDAGELLEYDYNTIMRQVYHSTPSFSVTQKGSTDGHFGIEKYTIKDALGSIAINDIYSVNDGNVTYKYGGAVFVKDDRYTFELSGYEEYTNADEETPVTSRVPLSGVVVTINNALSSSQGVYVESGTVDGEDVVPGQVADLKSNQMELNDEGYGTYTWQAGLPNITAPFTRTINMSYDIDGRSYLWSGLTGVILGEMPTGNNFVTEGPDELLMILRDPPGSSSSAEWSKGTTVTKSTMKGDSYSETFSNELTIKFGYSEGIITGTPAVGTVKTVDSDDDLTVGTSLSGECVKSNTQTTATTVTTAINTKGKGDVFIGNSTNIIFGKARNLCFQRVEGGESVELGVKDIISTGMKFGTMFNYSLSYIEETLFPNLISMRNELLTTTDMSETEIASYENMEDEPVYLTTLSKEDEHFGEKGTYTFVAPKYKAGVYTDQVEWANLQLKNWVKYLELNEKEKVLAQTDVNAAKTKENHSFDSGSDFNYSIETEEESVSTVEWSMGGTVVVNNNYGFDFTGIGFESNISNEFSTADIGSTEEGTTQTTSFSYTLAEDDDYDALTVDVYNYGAFGPIFHTVGGQTSNPYEGEVRTKYYEPGEHVLMEATMQIEVPQIDVDQPVVSDIPSGSVANYVLKLSNASEIGADVAYRIMLLDDTNENGAQLTMDGMPLTGEGRLIKVPGNQTLTKALQLRQTDTGVLDYENIGIVFASDSEPDEIFDDVYITARFTPSSSAVDLALNNSIINTQTGTSLKLTFNNFDRNYKNLKAFRLQYKKQGSTDWTNLKEYVLNAKDTTDIIKLLPAGASIDYMLDMNQFTDGDYLFRVLSVATYGTGEVYRSSEELALVKDMQRPRPLGQPEPADGILSVGDELSVTFNETILKGELTQAANFKVTGVLNGAEVAHETALSLQNTEATAQTEADILLSGKDFSIDTWVNLTGGEGTLLSHGRGNAKMTVGIDADNHLVVKIGSETYTSENTIPTDSWAFLTLSYKNEDGAGKLTATVAKDADETALFNNMDVVKYEGNGPLAVGNVQHSTLNVQRSSAIHELLLWDEAHDMTEALLQRSRTKNPATRHLIGYWKMDEGEGTTIRDYSRNRHMTMPAETWCMNNENIAVSLADGNFLSIDAGDLPSFDEDDYAVEFWVRGDEQSGDAQLLQMGEIGLWMNASGELQFTGKGAYSPVAEQISVPVGSPNGVVITDNVWHHVALNVLRQGAAAIYVDGVRRLSTNAANVGGIATNNLLLGAHRRMVMNDDEGVYAYDRPFTGQVDEVRVWNATLNGDKLLSNRKQRLTGTEDGLSAYYPFETKQLDQYGQVVTTASAEDLARKGHAAVLGGSAAEMAYTDDAPALRLKKTETNVPFTFVASNEKVVITIDEEPAMIEGCTLNFTVRDVRDENGNYSLPAVWSAFVNQNQLVWAENSLALEQPQNTTGTLQATVVNKGGQQQMWTLSGMPAWLVPNTESGETNPLSQTVVDFTVMPSAPLGRSEVTIYLTGNDNIDVPLTLNVKVNGDKPDWAVNPHDFEGSMNVIGQLFVDNIVSNDPDDIVAAFIGEECRGIANLEYSARYDGYFLTMDIFGNGNDNGADINFRAYDASTGTLYPVVNPDVTIKYAALGLQGSYASPVKLTTSNEIEQQIELRKGWNWMSLYVNTGNGNMTPSAVFAKVIDDVEVVKCHNEFAKRTDDILDGSLETIENGKMYAVKMSNDRSLRLVGSRANISVTLAPNWNWIGYGQQLASVTDALANMSPMNGDVLKGQQGVAYVDAYEWAGSLLTMQPGKGYQLWSGKAITFSYPNSVTGAAASRMVTTEANTQSTHYSSLFTPVDYHLFADNMTMTAMVKKAGQTLTNAEIGVFADGDECRATAVTREDGRAYITIPGDEECQLTFLVAVNGKVYGTTQTVNYAVDAEYGSYSSPFIIDLDNATGIEALDDLTQLNNCYDLQGRKVNVPLGFAAWLDQERSTLKKGIYVVNGQKKVIK